LGKNFFRLLFVLWAGSLCSTVWVALTLFYSQPDRHLAGSIAAKLFSTETYLGVAVAILALVLESGARFRGGFLAVGLLLVNEWALKPVMEHARLAGTALGLGFGAWHGLSALLYLTACLAVLWLVWKPETLRATG
jgi:hypothetical protein